MEGFLSGLNFFFSCPATRGHSKANKFFNGIYSNPTCRKWRTGTCFGLEIEPKSIG